MSTPATDNRISFGDSRDLRRISDEAMQSDSRELVTHAAGRRQSNDVDDKVATRSDGIHCHRLAFNVRYNDSMICTLSEQKVVPEHERTSKQHQAWFVFCRSQTTIKQLILEGFFSAA
jgi:hypothetical protein